jgi:mannobiose 2-epimerase
MVKTLKLPDTAALLADFARELKEEAHHILNYWIQYTPDRENRGFYGTVSNENITGKNAPKGLVMNCRILWTFSYAFNNLPADRKLLVIAARAYRYILDHFTDHVFGGVYWSVDCHGKMLDGKKQVYGLAFCIYGMAEYYKASGDKQALHFAKELFGLIEEYSYDKERGGYLEAFTRGWQPVGDLRLSDKDQNEKKTMNTHLHIIEAYVSLYSIWKDERLKSRIKELLGVFDKYIINAETRHLNLFMDEMWNVKPSVVSFGHDIEAARLLQEAAEILQDEKYIRKFRRYAVSIADAAMKGMDKDGGLWHEYDPGTNHWLREKHWWPQAEALVGYMNAFELTGDEKYLHHSLGSWAFIKRYIKDYKNGEWFWGVNEDHSVMFKEDKAGFWKCPYHNVRACIETGKRITKLKRTQVLEYYQ